MPGVPSPTNAIPDFPPGLVRANSADVPHEFMTRRTGVLDAAEFLVLG
jgi:hypothetical protein